eukprot:363811-Chlamydomonas_euryale.AAC.1
MMLHSSLVLSNAGLLQRLPPPDHLPRPTPCTPHSTPLPVTLSLTRGRLCLAAGALHHARGGQPVQRGQRVCAAAALVGHALPRGARRRLHSRRTAVCASGARLHNARAAGGGERKGAARRAPAMRAVVAAAGHVGAAAVRGVRACAAAWPGRGGPTCGPPRRRGQAGAVGGDAKRGAAGEVCAAGERGAGRRRLWRSRRCRRPGWRRHARAGQRQWGWRRCRGRRGFGGGAVGSLCGVAAGQATV